MTGQDTSSAQATMDATAVKLGGIGAGFYFDDGTAARGDELGLDLFHFYFLGRGGVLGDVHPEVIGSAFGYFHQGMIEKMWTEALEHGEPRATADAYAEACAVWGRKVFGGTEGLEGFCQAAEEVIEAAPLAGLALFAGWKNQPLAEDTPGRAAQLAAVLRELRGSAHVAAVVAAGLRPEVAHAMKRPDMVRMFGWAEAPEVTDADRELAIRAEALTDDVLRSSYAVLDDAAAAALVAGVDSMASALEG